MNTSASLLYSLLCALLCGLASPTLAQVRVPSWMGEVVNLGDSIRVSVSLEHVPQSELRIELGPDSHAWTLTASLGGQRLDTAFTLPASHTAEGDILAASLRIVDGDPIALLRRWAVLQTSGEIAELDGHYPGPASVASQCGATNATHIDNAAVTMGPTSRELSSIRVHVTRDVVDRSGPVRRVPLSGVVVEVVGDSAGRPVRATSGLDSTGSVMFGGEWNAESVEVSVLSKLEDGTTVLVAPYGEPACLRPVRDVDGSWVVHVGAEQYDPAPWDLISLVGEIRRWMPSLPPVSITLDRDQFGAPYTLGTSIVVAGRESASDAADGTLAGGWGAWIVAHELAHIAWGVRAQDETCMDAGEPDEEAWADMIAAQVLVRIPGVVIPGALSARLPRDWKTQCDVSEPRTQPETQPAPLCRTNRGSLKDLCPV